MPRHVLSHSLSGTLAVAWSERAGQPCLRIEGLLEEPHTILPDELDAQLGVVPAELVADPARLGASSNGPLPSMAGVFECDGSAVCFVPRFSFADGVEYAVLLDGRVVQTISRPARLPAP